MQTHQQQFLMQRDFPIGDVITNDLKKSITRETTNQFLKNFDGSIGISSVTNNTQLCYQFKMKNIVLNHLSFIIH